MRETLDELIALARKDVYEGRHGAAVEWMALHARARAAATMAERALSRVEARDRDTRVRLLELFLTEERKMEIAMAGPSAVEIGNAEALYAEATERVAFCEHVIGVLTSRFGRSTEAPAKRPPAESRQTDDKPAPRFGAIKGGKR